MKVIHAKNLPVRFPVAGTIACYLLLEHFTAPGWVYGVVFTVLGIIWVGGVFQLARQSAVDIFEGKP